MTKLFDLSGKVALVTGGSRGIGFMLARGLLDHGARVYISSRKATACERAVAELSAHGDCIALPADVGRLSEIEKLVADLDARAGGRLDILINNAGTTWGAPLEEFPEQGWDKVMNLNLKSVFFLTQKLLPLLKSGAAAQNPARIVNIGSVDGLSPDSYFETVSYATSKAGLHFLTQVLAARLAKHHITVNAIAPGFFDTDMLIAVVSAEDPKMLERIPLGRVGVADDIAGVAVMLCARAGAHITGTVVPVDGGLSQARLSPTQG
jgi:NAD(P)-dependent dehydrogenase (short-subunit alcohol dehydrogenase family)